MNMAKWTPFLRTMTNDLRDQGYAIIDESDESTIRLSVKMPMNITVSINEPLNLSPTFIIFINDTKISILKPSTTTICDNIIKTVIEQPSLFKKALSVYETLSLLHRDIQIRTIKGDMEIIYLNVKGRIASTKFLIKYRVSTIYRDENEREDIGIQLENEDFVHAFFGADGTWIPICDVCDIGSWVMILTTNNETRLLRAFLLAQRTLVEESMKNKYNIEGRKQSIASIDELLAKIDSCRT